jgi:ubiquinone biosynthesis protein
MTGRRPLEANTADTTSILGVAVRDLDRLRKVTTTVARHGFGGLLLRSPLARFLDKDAPDDEIARQPAARRFKRLLESLGPTYIKLGQVLSTRPDLLPNDYIEELKSLQDGAAPLPFAQVREVVEQALGAPILDVFDAFDEQPLATASIAQTHLATTRQGERVVVKVQRPNIEKIMRGDLDLLYLGARILEATIEEVDIYSPSNIVAEFERALLQELNFTYELSNLQTAALLLSPDLRVRVPRAYPDLSGRRVLTMEFFEGVSLRQLEPDSPRAHYAVEQVLTAGSKQIFLDGFFHGDPHPGNILINDDDEVCIIDWGLVGRLTRQQREDIVTLVIAAIANDVDTLARILLKLGRPTQRIHMAEFKGEITRIRSQQLVVGSFDDYDSRQFVQEFVSAAQKFRIKLATEYTLLVKVATTGEGLVRSLHPNADVIRLVRPWAEQVLKDRYNPQQMLQDALGGVTGVGSLIRLLPGQVDQVMHDIETGNLQVRAITPSLEHAVPTLHQLSKRLSLALFAAAMSITTAQLLSIQSDNLWLNLLSIFCLILTVLSWVLLWSLHLVGHGKARISPLVSLFKRR